MIIAVFAVAVFAFFFDVIVGPRVLLDANPSIFDPWRGDATQEDLRGRTYRPDGVLTYLPRRVELSRSIRSGRFPLWNQHIFAGMPFFADPQSRVIYPIARFLVAA